MAFLDLALLLHSYCCYSPIWKPSIRTAILSTDFSMFHIVVLQFEVAGVQVEGRAADIAYLNFSNIVMPFPTASLCPIQDLILGRWMDGKNGMDLLQLDGIQQG